MRPKCDKHVQSYSHQRVTQRLQSWWRSPANSSGNTLCQIHVWQGYWELNYCVLLQNLPSVEVRKAEIAPRLSINDYLKVMPFGLGLDVRSNAQYVSYLLLLDDLSIFWLSVCRFKTGHMPLSMNVQPQQLATFAPILKKLNKKYHTVLADQDSDGAEVLVWIL